MGENNIANRSEDCSGHRTGSNQFWFVDSGCSRHITGGKSNFLSLAATQGGSVVFDNEKSGIIVGIGKIVSHSLIPLMVYILMG